MNTSQPALVLLAVLSTCGCAGKWAGATAYWSQWERPDGTHEVRVAVYGRAADPIEETCLTVSPEAEASLDGLGLTIVGSGGGAGLSFPGPGSEVLMTPDAEGDCLSACCSPIKLSARSDREITGEPVIAIREGDKTQRLRAKHVSGERAFPPFLSPPADRPLDPPR